MRNSLFMKRYPLKMTALVVLAGTMLASLGVTYARLHTGSKGMDQVRIAGYKIVVGDLTRVSAREGLDCSIPGDRLVYRLPIQNHSEVSINYQVNVGNTESLNCLLTNGSGRLVPGGYEEVLLSFSVADEDDYSQSSLISGISVDVLTQQAE